MRKGDAGVYMEDEYLQFVTDNTDQFAKVLEQFQNEDNYPILISCSYGKDRTGFLTAMLLAALDIPGTPSWRLLDIQSIYRYESFS